MLHCGLDTSSACSHFLTVNSLCLKVDVLFALCGDITFTSTIASQCASSADLASSSHCHSAISVIFVGRSYQGGLIVSILENIERPLLGVRDRAFIAFRSGLSNIYLTLELLKVPL